MTMDYASRIRRLAAGVLDIIVMLIIFVILEIAGGVETADPEEQFNAARTFAWAVIVLIYYVGFTAARGQTLGKMAMGIKVVNVDGEKPDLGTVLTRDVVRVMGTVLYVVFGLAIDPDTGLFIGGIVALIVLGWILFDDRRRGLHDKAAKTFVVMN